MITAIQLIEPARGEADAQSMLDALTLQIDYLGGRLLPPCNQHPSHWHVQAFFSSDGIRQDSWLPDGCRFVFVPESLRRSLNIPE